MEPSLVAYPAQGRLGLAQVRGRTLLGARGAPWGSRRIGAPRAARRARPYQIPQRARTRPRRRRARPPPWTAPSRASCPSTRCCTGTRAASTGWRGARPGTSWPAPRMISGWAPSRARPSLPCLIESDLDNAHWLKRLCRGTHHCRPRACQQSAHDGRAAAAPSPLPCSKRSCFGTRRTLAGCPSPSRPTTG